MTDPIDSADERLERTYRRLLRAYPAWYRYERGEEMLTTLLDAAQGRDKPTTSERLDLVFGGLRKHLAAGSLPAAVIGALAAAFIATLGAIGGAVAGWHTAADLPDDAAADRIARQAIPDMTTETFGDRSLFYWESMMGEPMDSVFAIDDGDDHNAGRLIYEMEHDIDELGRFHVAKERIAAAGWDVQSTRTDSWGAEFTATKDGLDLIVSTTEDSESPSLSHVYISRHTPDLVPALTVAGLVLGGLAGWLVSGRLLRNAYRRSTYRHAVGSSLLGLGGLLLAVPTVINLYYVGLSLAMPEEKVPVWLGYTFGPFAVATLLGAGALAIAFLCFVIPTLPHRAAQTAR